LITNNRVGNFYLDNTNALVQSKIQKYIHRLWIGPLWDDTVAGDLKYMKILERSQQLLACEGFEQIIWIDNRVWSAKLVAKPAKALAKKFIEWYRRD